MFGLSRQTIIKIMVTSFLLGLYEIFIKPLYKQYVGEYGLSQATFGYAMVFLSAYIISWFLLRGGKG